MMYMFRDFHSMDLGLQRSAVELLAREFYGVDQIESGASAFSDSIASGKETVYCLLVDHELAGG